MDNTVILVSRSTLHNCFSKKNTVNFKWFLHSQNQVLYLFPIWFNVVFLTHFNIHFSIQKFTRLLGTDAMFRFEQRPFSASSGFCPYKKMIDTSKIIFEWRSILWFLSLYTGKLFYDKFCYTFNENLWKISITKRKCPCLCERYKQPNHPQPTVLFF